MTLKFTRQYLDKRIPFYKLAKLIIDEHIKDFHDHGFDTNKILGWILDNNIPDSNLINYRATIDEYRRNGSYKNASIYDVVYSIIMNMSSKDNYNDQFSYRYYICENFNNENDIRHVRGSFYLNYAHLLEYTVTTELRGKYEIYFESEKSDYVDLTVFFDNVTDDGENLIESKGSNDFFINVPPASYIIWDKDPAALAKQICDEYPNVYDWIKCIYGPQRDFDYYRTLNNANS